MKYRHILLIDDDTDDHEIFIAALAKVSEDVKCVGFTDAGKALQKLKNGELETDVIFLDLNMPIMNGQQFLHLIKQENTLKDLSVVVFSTSSLPATIQITKEMGAMDFITKPDKFDELVSILKFFLI